MMSQVQNAIKWHVLILSSTCSVAAELVNQALCVVTVSQACCFSIRFEKTFCQKRCILIDQDQFTRAEPGFLSEYVQTVFGGVLFLF